jgi:hypothetical protein
MLIVIIFNLANKFKVNPFFSQGICNDGTVNIILGLMANWNSHYNIVLIFMKDKFNEVIRVNFTIKFSFFCRFKLTVKSITINHDSY